MTEEKVYKFRKLTSKDLFLMIKFIKKIGINNISKILDKDIIKEKINELTQKSNEEANEETSEETSKASISFEELGISIMFDLAQLIIERLEACEEEIYEILEKTSNLNKEQIEELEIDVFIEMIYDFVRKEEFIKLFQKAASLLKSEK